jgi:hypothetical protein
VKRGMVALLLAVTLTGFASGRAFAQAPPGSGNPLQIETRTSELSGTAGQYVKLPARITNASKVPVKDVVAYVTLVEITKGQKAPVDLEDWSAHRAVTIGSLAPGHSRDASWSLRLVKGGHYVIYANAIEKGSSWAAVGQEVPLTVMAHKNLNPGGVLPVALGVPVLVGAALFGPVFARRRNLNE